MRKYFRHFSDEGTSGLLGVFNRDLDYFDEHQLFMAHFNAIPNCVHEEKIDCWRANQWLLDTHQAEIIDRHYIKRIMRNKNETDYDDLYYFLYDDLLLYLNTNHSKVSLLYRKTDEAKVNGILSGVKKFRKKVSRKPEINLLTQSGSGLRTISMPITKPKLTLDDNYNDDLKPVHQTILKRLARKNDKGLVLLHGKPGTGKTSYIRYLISSVRKKTVIFLPPNMAAAITNPDLISILINNPNSIFVIEDAENIIIDRNKKGNSSVSALLNIADGLLSDCLNIQVICSFNTDISQVDNALMRKGRLIAKYEFKELEVSKAQTLSDKLGFPAKIVSPMTLTAIYNQDETDFQLEQCHNTIGFRAIQVGRKAI